MLLFALFKIKIIWCFMKVLVYGEYSGYGKSLAKGFNELGYHAEVLSFGGDGFKKIKGDISFHDENKFIKLFKFIALIPRILSFDNIIVLNPSFFGLKYLGPIVILLAKIKGIRINLLACGDDVEFIKQGKLGNLGSWPYIDTQFPDVKYYTRLTELFVHKIVANVSYRVIPVMYDYQKAWSLSKYKNKVVSTIPLACDGMLINLKTKVFGEKIRIMHGINREDFKGTRKIILALNKIKSEYINDVEVLLPEKLPFEEYMKLLESVDISIDQTKGNSYGMNAIYGLLSGHVVLAPANDFFKKDLCISNCPIIPIINDENDIYVNLKWLIENREKLDEIKRHGQEYALMMHAPKIVAEKMSKYLLK